MYLFIGIGSIVSFLLILTLIQLYIKCKSSKRKAKAKCTRSKTNMPINSEPATCDDQRGNYVAAGGCVNYSPYRPLKAVYAEIPENIEMHTKKISNQKETMETLPSYLPLKSENTTSNCPTEDYSSEPNLGGSSLDSTTSNLYISPVFIPKGTQSKEDTDEDISLLWCHTGIEIIQIALLSFPQKWYKEDADVEMSILWCHLRIKMIQTTFWEYKSFTTEGICYPRREKDNFHMFNDQVILKVFSAYYTMFSDLYTDPFF